MNKKLLFALPLMFCTAFAFGQIKVVAPNGDVGVGTSTPTEKLHVEGTVFSKTGFVTSNGSAMAVRYNCFGNDLLARNLFRPETPATNGFYISGNGTGTLAGYRTQLAMFGTDYGADNQNWYAMFLNAGPTNNGINMHKAGSGAVKNFNLSVLLTPKFTMTPQGKIGIGTTTPDAGVLLDVKGAIGYNGTLDNTSDKNLKKNVNNFKYGLDEVVTLNPITYYYTGEMGTNSEREHVGIFAQDLQKVAPELVNDCLYIEPEYTVKNAESENPEIILNVNRKSSKYLSIQESAIKYMLINAVKEQQDIINDQEQKIEELESRLDQIENLLENLAQNEAFESIELQGSDKVFLSNNPNPFNGVTTIEYVFPEGSSNVVIQILDAQGKLLRTVDLDNSVQKGSIEVKADALPSGTYSYLLMADGQVLSTKKMVLTK